MPLRIAQLGQPVLRRVAREVSLTEIASAEFQSLLSAMRATLRHHHGAGLAAPQVFDSRRVFLAAILPPANGDDEPEVETFINPRLLAAADDEVESWEGCLSFPELLVKVARPIAVRIEYLDAGGQRRVADLADFAARVAQHELDHLNGILTLDRAKSTHDIIKASEIDTVLGRKGEGQTEIV
ncbi:MAG: peptide deformylase [Gemmataceae bacterium]|nr:peptide deformylase [Gemmataceae bacterium]